MSSEEDQNQGINGSSRLLSLLLLGIALVSVGLVVLFVAMLVLGGSGSIGGVIFIGPIPIVFGAGPNAEWLIAVGLAISIISVVLFAFMYRRKIKF
jgi:uncharacterized membrane protein